MAIFHPTVFRQSVFKNNPFGSVFGGQDSGPTFAWDFTRGNLPKGLTFTRASSATYFDSTGVLQTASNNIPRFDYNPVTLTPRGLLIEGARTNSYTNSSWNASGLSFPTGAAVTVAGGLSINVVKRGVEDGISYTDIRFNGTATESIIQINPQTTNVPASSGQAWTVSHYVKLVGGTLNNVSAIQLHAGTVGGTAGADTNYVPTTGSLKSQRVSTTITTDAGTTAISSRFRLLVTSGAEIDVTIRYAGLQLELGSFATSPIPTSGAVATRASDTAVITNLNSIGFNANEGTLVSNVEIVVPNSSGSGKIPYSIFNSSDRFNNRIYQEYYTDTNTNLRTAVGAGGAASAQFGFPIGPGVVKSAFAYKVNDFAICCNGGSVSVDTLGNLPSGLNTLSFGNLSTSDNFQMFGYTRSFVYYPTRLPNAILQQLST